MDFQRGILLESDLTQVQLNLIPRKRLAVHFLPHCFPGLEFAVFWPDSVLNLNVGCQTLKSKWDFIFTIGWKKLGLQVAERAILP